MSPSESDPSPRTVATRGPAETATPSTTASQGTIARPLNDGRSEGPGNSERTPVAAETQMSSPAPPGPAVTSRPDRVWIPDPSLHHIVIVGGGAAGLELATKLGDSLGRRKKAQITLVERARTHIWKPHLHEVAAGTMDVGRDAVDYLAQASDHHFRYRIGEMVGLDRGHREVHLAPSLDAEGHEVTPARAVPYDTLVMAVGSTSNDFGTPGAKDFAISLDTADEAVRFHQRLVNRFIRAHAQPGPVRPGQLHVTIIGAGATGTELAAELHRTTRQVVAYGLDRIDPEKDLKITLVEAAERILPAVPPRVAEGATRLLKKLGIDVRTQARVVEVRQDGVRLADGDFIPSELVVWAAGVKGPDLLTGSRWSGGKPEQSARRDADTADDAGSRRVCDGRLRVSAQSRRDKARSAAGPSRQPAGDPSRQSDETSPGRETPAAICLPGLRIPRFTGRVQHGWQSDGICDGQRPDDRGLLCTTDVPVALQDAPEGPVWRLEGDARHHGPRSTRRTEPRVKLH